ncbi:MAG: hypothetical protein DHS20C18_29580 [Saprospiraceae bacterium]|nr:MAG: hypothetical protein DHS20C18_29580 [Saprospiraceae bacterium]
MNKHLTFLVIYFCVANLMAQTSYYVSQNLGTDANGFGLSPTTPFQTINYALDDLDAGDTLNVMAGVYYNDTYGNGDIWKNEKTVSINNKHGNEHAYIVIRPYQDHAVKLKGDGLYILHIRNCSYIRITGFEIEGEVNSIPLDSALAYQFAYRELGSDVILFRVTPGTPPEVVETLTFEPLTDIERPSYYDTKGLVGQLSHHIEVINNHIHHTPGTGLRFNSSGYIKVIGNEVHDCSRRSYSGTHALVFEACDDMNTDTDTKIWILRNHIHHNYNEIYSWAPSKTIITPIIDEGKGISMQRNDVERGWEYGRIRIENNLTHHNGFSGLHTNSGRAIDFINNTSYYDSYTGNGNNHGISMQASEDITIINNIVVNDIAQGGFGIAASNSSSNYTIDNNLVHGTIDTRVDAVDNNTIFADPLFTNPESLDFTLRSISPAIGAALPAFAPADDYRGLARDVNPDLGAFEYSPATSISSNNADKQIIHVYPNPFREKVIIEMSNNPPITIALFDMVGRSLINDVKVSFNGYRLEINTSNLENGIYFLNIEGTVHTLFKQH